MSDYLWGFRAMFPGILPVSLDDEVDSEMFRNMIFLMEPTEDLDNISLKCGNMYLNRFCTDENAAFELYGIYKLHKSAFHMRASRIKSDGANVEKEKGKGNLKIGI